MRKSKDNLESWDDLRYFLAVAREGSLSAAARLLGVNPSTVYRRIGTLEGSVGSRLFDRLAKAYVLTPPGEALLESAARVEEAVYAAGREVLGSDRATSGRVRFTTADVFALALLAPHLAAFHAAYPRIELDVTVGPETKSLSRREADVAFRPGPRPSEGDVIARHVSRVAVAVYASAGYLSAHGTPRRLQDLGAHRLVTGDESVEHVRFMRVLREAAPQATVTYRGDSVLSQAVAVRAGFGVAALPVFFAESLPELRCVIGPLEELAVDAWLVIHRDLRHTARVRAFVDHLTASLSRDVARLEGQAKTAAGRPRRRPQRP